MSCYAYFGDNKANEGGVWGMWGRTPAPQLGNNQVNEVR